jgi:hypothetical protein
MTIPLVCEKEQATTKTKAKTNVGVLPHSTLLRVRMTNGFLWFAKEKDRSKGQRQVGVVVERESRWRSGFLRCAARKSASDFGRNDGS